MEKEIATQVQETQRVPNRINPRQNIPRHILIKLMKNKQKRRRWGVYLKKEFRIMIVMIQNLENKMEL